MAASSPLFLTAPFAFDPELAGCVGISGGWCVARLLLCLLASAARKPSTSPCVRPSSRSTDAIRYSIAGSRDPPQACCAYHQPENDWLHDGNGRNHTAKRHAEQQEYAGRGQGVRNSGCLEVEYRRTIQLAEPTSASATSYNNI